MDRYLIRVKSRDARNGNPRRERFLLQREAAGRTIPPIEREFDKWLLAERAESIARRWRRIRLILRALAFLGVVVAILAAFEPPRRGYLLFGAVLVAIGLAGATGVYLILKDLPPRERALVGYAVLVMIIGGVGFAAFITGFSYVQRALH